MYLLYETKLWPKPTEFHSYIHIEERSEAVKRTFNFVENLERRAMK
jgi:hypothetical protein